MATGKSNAFSGDLLKLIFQNVTLASISSPGIIGSASAGSLFLSLHTADPGAGGSQTTSEAAYTSYARVTVARSAAGWTVTGQTVTLTSQVSFPAGTGGGETCTYIGIGGSLTAAGYLAYRATLSPSIVTGAGVTPQISTATGLTEA